MEKVLLIDDERDALDVLEWTLTDLGYEVRAETDAQRALDVAQEFRPDVVVTDYFLRHELCGLDIIRKLREERPLLRAVLMTGVMAEDLRAELAEVGSVDVLRKPFLGRDLVTRLEVEHRSCA